MGGIDDSFMKIMNTTQEAGLTEAEAKILKHLLNEQEPPLFHSSLESVELVPFIVLKTFSELYGLEQYKRFIIAFLKSKIPEKRKRVQEILRALRRESEDEKKSLWDRMRGK